MTRDLQSNDRQQDDKIRSLRAMMDDKINKVQSENEVYLDQIKTKLAQFDAKMA